MTTAVVRASALDAAFAVASGPPDGNSTRLLGRTRTTYPTARASAGSAAATATSRPLASRRAGPSRPPPIGARPGPRPGRRPTWRCRPRRATTSSCLTIKADAHQARPPSRSTAQRHSWRTRVPTSPRPRPASPCAPMPASPRPPMASPAVVARAAMRARRRRARSKTRGAPKSPLQPACHGQDQRRRRPSHGHQRGGLGGDSVRDRRGGDDDGTGQAYGQAARPADEGSRPRRPHQRRRRPAPGAAPSGPSTRPARVDGPTPDNDLERRPRPQEHDGDERDATPHQARSAPRPAPVRRGRAVGASVSGPTRPRWTGGPERPGRERGARPAERRHAPA